MFDLTWTHGRRAARRPGRGRWTLAVAAALALAPMSGHGVEELRFSGTGTALGTFERLAKVFEQTERGYAVKVVPNLGSSGAIRAVADGALDLGLSGRPLRAEERQAGLVELAYARTPFLFAVGPRVTATSITPALLARIYRGEETRWPDGGRIRLVLRPSSDVDTDLVRAISPELDAAVGLAQAREGMVMAATNQECDRVIAGTPGAIGPSSLTQLLTEPAAPRAVAWNGVAPTLKNLASGAYPLEKRLYLVARKDPTPSARRFIDFLRTPAARRILEQTGNLPLDLPPLR